MLPELQAIDHVHVYVPDRDKAESWYSKVLGLFRCEALAFWAKDGGPLTLQNGSGSVHLALFERHAQPCRSTVALRVGVVEYLSWTAHLERQLPQAAHTHTPRSP
ncbi:catechol 2,3-dioxygenase-like lactoylglutathione lyase family enzyme [Hydrogenophaga palleronii]|uniref:Catechol 2,3-dioxygenase-like lactoylglutathione lyase family enzyme n=1 Tax=Hydrogenophaga palleronii TaxID=65655 RepID=A0ABU1WNQ5_9BURK|nr:VOC family protein [Hydrogenophaga palleronii]MDR7150908.1 catechol 2,3-dioxygenase-like lactoylglutathione lyase family enzyme [Hydrogenophaga palleronii]